MVICFLKGIVTEEVELCFDIDASLFGFSADTEEEVVVEEGSSGSETEEEESEVDNV